MDKAQPTFTYSGEKYPDYIRQGNAVEHIVPTAKKFCRGLGLDIGGTKEWHLPGAEIINSIYGEFDALSLPEEYFGCDYIFSSHCLEHLPDYIKALEYWRGYVRPGGQVFLYLPHHEMEYWRPEHCRKHVHTFTPERMREVFEALGFEDIFISERDLYWSFAITGVAPEKAVMDVRV